MSRLVVSLAVFVLMTASKYAGAAENATTLTVSANQSIRKMVGGIGASWHAIRVEYKNDTNAPYKYDVRHDWPQGSAVGANPPLDSAAWQDIERQASWLGLDWLRVEIDRRMYEPEKARFDWDNEEMRTLYRILDWCQRNDADVFLTEMWRDVKWLAYPDVHPLVSAPNSLDDFAEGLAALAEHLVRDKHYTCIKWLCIANEPPGGTWGYWWSRGADNAPFSPALKAVRQALDHRGLGLPLSGPDWTDLPKLDRAKIDFSSDVGAFDLHSYSAPGPEMSQVVAEWTRWAHGQGKPFFLTELGDMSLGWGTNNPGPASFKGVLSTAEKILRGMALGVDGFNRWSFVNRGDQDGQWQLIRTWNMNSRHYREHADPEPVPFYGYAMLTRFTAKNSDILPYAWISPNDTLFAGALRSPKGHLTTIIANRADAAVEIRIRMDGLAQSETFHRYELTEAALKVPGFELRPLGHFAASPSTPEFSASIPGNSLVVFTTFELEPDAPGIISER